MNKEGINYYKELPECYIEDKVIDAKDKKTSFKFILYSTLLLILTCVALFPRVFSLRDNRDSNLLIVDIAFIISMFAYIVLHELTHGLVYKIMTHEKLTFGMTLTVAYCGVPNLYVTKKTALLSILAPFTVFAVLLLPPIFIIDDLYICAALSLIFAIHFSGCVGDLYGAIVLIFKYKGKDILMNDTGPKQTFYIKKED